MKEEAEELRADQESGEWLLKEEDGEGEILSGESEEVYESSMESEEEQESLCMILAEAKKRNQDREMHAGPFSGTYNLDCDDANGGEDLKIIAVSRKPFRELSFNSNVRTNLESVNDREILSRIMFVKFKRLYPQSRRDDRANDRSEGACESEVQVIRTDSGTEE